MINIKKVLGKEDMLFLVTGKYIDLTDTVKLSRKEKTYIKRCINICTQLGKEDSTIGLMLSSFTRSVINPAERFLSGRSKLKMRPVFSDLALIICGDNPQFNMFLYAGTKLGMSIPSIVQ